MYTDLRTALLNPSLKWYQTSLLTISSTLAVKKNTVSTNRKSQCEWKIVQDGSDTEAMLFSQDDYKKQGAGEISVRWCKIWKFNEIIMKHQLMKGKY